MPVLLSSDFAKQSIILLFMQHLDSTLKLKKGWFSLKSSHSSGPKVTPFIDEAEVISKKAAKVMNGKTYMLGTDMITGAPSTAHILGGAVIGKDANEGVIDTKQNVFSYNNMMVCDGSAVSANPGVNPSLTITAMTERVMSMIPTKDS